MIWIGSPTALFAPPVTYRLRDGVVDRMRLLRFARFAAVPAVLALSACEGDRRVLVVEEDFDLGDIAELHLDQRAGDLAIHGEEGRDSVHLVVALRSARLSDGRDEAAKKALRIGLSKLDGDAGRLVAGLHRPPLGYYVDVTAFVPAEIAMTIEDNSGDATITGIAALTIDDDSGDLSIEDIAGAVHVDDDSGDIDIRGVGGDITIDDDSGDISVSGVDGSVDLSGASGDLRVTSVGGDVEVDDRSGDMQIIDVAGAVLVRDRSGDIEIVNAGDADILSDGSGDVSIR